MGVVAIGVVGCESDPAAYGITGPYPEGIIPVTLMRRQPQSDVSDDTPGVHADASDRYAPSARLGLAPPTRRYYGYDY